jgi:hypothetical protein
MNTDQTPTRFEDRLLGELNAIVERNPSPVTEPEPIKRRAARPARPARRLAFAGGMALALAAAAAVVLATGDPDSAYAVDQSTNGSISVEVHSLSDAAGLETKLRAAGLNATVNYNVDKKSCIGPLTRPGVEVSGDKGDEPKSIQGQPNHVEGAVSAEGPKQITGHSSHIETAGGTVAGQAGPGKQSLSSAGTPPPPGADGPGGGPVLIQQTADGAKFTIDPDSVPKDAALIIDANSDGGLQSLGVSIVKSGGSASSSSCESKP